MKKENIKLHSNIMKIFKYLVFVFAFLLFSFLLKNSLVKADTTVYSHSYKNGQITIVATGSLESHDSGSYYEYTDSTTLKISIKSNNDCFLGADCASILYRDEKYGTELVNGQTINITDTVTISFFSTIHHGFLGIGESNENKTIQFKRKPSITITGIVDEYKKEHTANVAVTVAPSATLKGKEYCIYNDTKKCEYQTFSGTEIKIKQFAKQFEEQLNIKELAKERLSLLDKNNNIDKEDTMGEEKNLSMSETDKEEKDIIMEEPKDEEEKVEETAEEKSMEEKEEEPQEEKEMGCGEEGKEMSDDSEQEEDKEEEDDEDDEKQKDFSLGSLIEEGEVTVLLEQFTESNLELAQKLLSMNVKEVLETVISFSEENAELKKFKEERVALDKEIKLSSIMASVKEDLDAKQFEELQKEGESLSYEMLDGFANKVKAFAYENTKQKTQQVAEDDIMRFGGTYTETNESNQDVFDRLSKM